jgi:hypothetical protein
MGRLPVLVHILTPGMGGSITQISGISMEHYPRASELQRKYPTHLWR